MQNGMGNTSTAILGSPEQLCGTLSNANIKNPMRRRWSMTKKGKAKPKKQKPVFKLYRIGAA